MLLKLNNDEVKIKVRGCADVRTQRNWLSKEDTSLPTVSIDGLMISYIIESMEGQDVATSDIPGASLQPEYNKRDIHINMEG